MNTTDGPQHTDPRHNPQRVVPTPADEALSVPRDRPEPEAVTTPEAVRAAQVARTEKQHAAVIRGRGVEWVRPTDLLVRSSGTLAGRGIEFNSEQGRRFRSTLATGARSVSERAKRLPPLSAFGRRGQHVEGPARSGVGMR